MWLRWEYQPVTQVRLLPLYLPEGASISTSEELKAIAEGEKQCRQQAETIAEEATQRRQQLESELEYFVRKWPPCEANPPNKFK